MNSASPIRSEWTIPADVIYLNHGSFGPAPRIVQQAREEWSRRLESQPMDFYLKQMEPALDDALACVALFVKANPRDLVFVDNATVAMNIVAATIDLAANDEVVVNDHEYGAVFRIWRRKCEQSGARLVTARLPAATTGDNCLTTAEQLIDLIFQAVTPRTRLIVVSHVTSPSAIILPVAQICQRARGLGIPVCIDGPHAIAMLDVRLADIDCDYYCASLHKWLSAPFGSGFLYVKRDLQQALTPHLTSWGRSLGGLPERWQDQFNWLGTRDPAPFLAVPAAIRFLEAAGIDRFRETTHQTAQFARNKLENLFQQPAWVPDSGDWYGSMAAVPLPPSDYKKPRPNSMHPLQVELRERFQIEVPITECRGDYLMRVSCHLYNTIEEIDRLITAIKSSNWRP